MFINRDKRLKGFTLLEILLAVCILGLIAVSIHRFVRTSMTAVRLSTEQAAKVTFLERFATFLRSAVWELPPDRPNALTGEPHRFGEFSQDEMRWVVPPGAALFTRNANTETLWKVTLTFNRDEIGLWRQEFDERSARTWLPLIGKEARFKGLEIRYFDARSRQWVERWNDGLSRPALVKVRLQRVSGETSHEITLPFPPVTAGAMPPTFQQARNVKQRGVQAPAQQPENENHETP